MTSVQRRSQQSVHGLTTFSATNKMATATNKFTSTNYTEMCSASDRHINHITTRVSDDS